MTKPEPTPEQYILAGKRIKAVLHLPTDLKGRIETSFGTKSMEGLARTVERILHETLT